MQMQRHHRCKEPLPLGIPFTNEFSINIGECSARALVSAQRDPPLYRIFQHQAPYIVRNFNTEHQLQTPSTNSVFLDCGSIEPAVCFRLPTLPAGNTHLRNSRKTRLLLAGDVESNPGPTSTPNRRRSGRPTPPLRRPQHQICDSCDRPIYKHQEAKALSCNQPECTGKTHRNCNKCDVSRYNMTV